MEKVAPNIILAEWVFHDYCTYGRSAVVMGNPFVFTNNFVTCIYVYWTMQGSIYHWLHLAYDSQADILKQIFFFIGSTGSMPHFAS